MNLYGETDGPEHQLFGRVGPICKALHLAIHRAAGKSVHEPELSSGMPVWCHKIIDKLVLTTGKGLVALAPQGKFDARNYGRIVGVILRGIVHFTKEVPARLKREGLLNLDPETEKQLESMVDMPSILSFASQKFGQPISDDDELMKAGTEKLEKTIEAQAQVFFWAVRYLLDRPVREQHEFLCGIPEGFIRFLDNNGGFTGQRQRTGLYFLLLTFWPEITEMQKSDPPKTCKFLLEWLEKQEGEPLVDDEKQFYGLCGEIGLVMAPPGHPRKAPPP